MNVRRCVCNSCEMVEGSATIAYQNGTLYAIPELSPLHSRTALCSITRSRDYETACHSPREDVVIPCVVDADA